MNTQGQDSSSDRRQGAVVAIWAAVSAAARRDDQPALDPAAQRDRLAASAFFTLPALDWPANLYA